MGEAVRKVTVNIPAKVLQRATQITGKGVTHTVIAGLLELQRREQRTALRHLKGRVAFDLDIETTRR